MTKPDLWPDFHIPERNELMDFLREQSQLLGEKTQDMVHGYIMPLTMDHVTTHMFYFRVPQLENYKYRLFSVRQEHDKSFVLIDLEKEVFGEIRNALKDARIVVQNNMVRVDNLDQFKIVLKEIFNSGRSRSLIEGFMRKLTA